MTVQTPSPIMTPFERGMGGQGIGQAHGNILSSRPFSSQSDRLAGQPSLLAHELVQGPLVKWSTQGSISRPPPTCVLIHGIMGSRRNMLSFAQRLTRVSFCSLLTCLHSVGEYCRRGPIHAATLSVHHWPITKTLVQSGLRPNSVESAAADILELLRHLRLFPEVLIGHSFGGKVVMSMADQFGRIGPRLPRPVQVWVLDALPGSAAESVKSEPWHRQDHPQDLIAQLQAYPLPIESRATLQSHLVQQGFSLGVAAWVTSNLKTSQDDPRNFLWSFDLKGIAEMYRSYETHSFWPFLSAPTPGIHVDFIRAQHSSYHWSKADLDRLAAYGHGVHTLADAGHWLHTDNPEGLLEILRGAFTSSPRLS